MADTYELYLIRHAIAESRGPEWPDDRKRPLTRDGIARMRKTARGLARLGVRFDVIATSPLVRARDTADIVASALEPHPPVRTIEALSPEGTYAEVLAALAKFDRHTRVALVGHEPGISTLAARLVGSRRPFPFKKGAVCRIDVDALPPGTAGDLRWFMPPLILRQIK